MQDLPRSNAGALFVVSAPSGAGKTSLLKALRSRISNLRVAISHTTRLPRHGERDGIHYHFVDQTTFMTMVSQGCFLEHAQVFDNFYGTTESAVHEVLRHGHSLCLEIDWQGAAQVRKRFPTACSIFILPPSLAALRARLASRAQDDMKTIARRMRDACKELSHYPEYDYLVVNDSFEQALNDLYCIVRAQETRIECQAVRLSGLLSDLLVGTEGCLID